MHILIFEATLSGHHANYLVRLSTLFLGQGHQVSVTLLEKYSCDPAIDKLLFNFPDRFKVIQLPESALLNKVMAMFGVCGSELKHWFMFRCAFKKINTIDTVDLAFFPYLDFCLHAISLFGSPSKPVSWAGICMRPSFHYRDFGVLAPEPKWRSLKAWLFRKLLCQRGLKKVFTIDELLEEHVNQKQPSLATRLMFVPDPAELLCRFDQTSARNILSLDHDEFTILVYGSIDQRKGIDQLLQGLRYQQLPRKVRVLVVGKHSPSLREQLRHEPLVTTIDSYADCNTEAAAFSAADAVWLGYRSHYVMSGVLILAAMAGKPVLATRNGLIGWMTQRYALGLTMDCEDDLELGNAVHSLLKEPISIQANFGTQTIQQRHTWSEFNSRILDALYIKNLNE